MGDSSQCRQLEEHLPEAEDIKTDDQLAAGLVSDIGNILTAISAYSAMLLEDLPPGPQRDLVREIQKVGEHGATLTRKLRQLSHTKANGRVKVIGRETILLVEDEENVRCIAVRVLRESGYTVLEARTAEDALLLAERWGNPIDLVLTDRVLPGMPGRELARRLTARHPQCRTLLMSGYPPDEEGPSGVLPADVKHLMKPFNVAMLTGKVREVLDSM
jgi:CheY-like chemotaxis protein